MVASSPETVKDGSLGETTREDGVGLGRSGGSYNWR
jgi:hypothetical protein